MEKKDNTNNRLSFKRFKDVDIKNLTKDELFDLYLSTLMKEIIEILEGALSNPQQFNRCKFSAMSAVHEFLAQCDKIKDLPDVK